MTLRDNEANKILQGISEQGKQTAPAAPVVNTTQATPVVENTAPVAPAAPPVQAEAPKAPVTPVAPEVKLDGVIEDWEPETKPTTQPSYDFSDIGKAIGFEGIKTREEFEGKVKEALQSKQAPDAYAGVPDNLKKAIEVAKNGGDYLQLLKVSQVDYSKIDPVKIYETWVAQQLTGPDGKVDETKYQDALASTTPIEKELLGRQKQGEYIAWQKNQEEVILRDQQARKQLADLKVREALDKVNDIHGFKLKPSHKTETFERITTGQMQKDLFYDKDGNFDYEKMISADFKVRNFDKIVDYLKGRAATAKTREILTDLQNVSVNVPSEKPTVEVKKQDQISDWIQSMKENSAKR